jgi:rhamnosyltransferase
MKASVIIPTKNGGSLFEKVLLAVISQKVPWPFEILVIDSGSTDGTLEFIHQIPNIRTHSIPPDQFGHGRTRNLGISMTKGDFAVFITQDAKPINNHWLYELISSVEQNSNIAGSFGRHIAYPDHGPFIARELDNHFDGLRDFGTIVKLEDPEMYKIDEGYRQALQFFSNNNSCIRRSVWEKIPFDDVDFSEDMVWAKNIIEAGYQKAYAHSAVVYHSHSFGILEGIQRGFDEAWSLKQHFGYKMFPSILHFLGVLGISISSDYFFGIKNGFLLRNPIWIFKVPIRVVSNQVGYFLGERADYFSKSLIDRLSRDKNLKKNKKNYR